MMNFLTAAAESKELELIFEPSNFVTNLKYMGIGMLVIFILIGIIALTTVAINKIFKK